MKKSALTRLAAMTMAATIVFGSTFTVYATEGSNPDNLEGIGTSEGHVEQKKTRVTLPTSAEKTADTFAYTMDPEGLIKLTGQGRYGEDDVFPADEGDTHVYFNNGGVEGKEGAVTYGNSSKSLKVTNNSSHDIQLTVKAEAVANEGGKDIPLVEQNELSGASAASLYLGLIVGTKSDTNPAKAILAGTAAVSEPITIPGQANNYKVAVETKEGKKVYVYRELTPAEYNTKNNLTGDAAVADDAALPNWEYKTFNLEGAVTSGKNIASDTTAPKVKVTWSWTDPEDGPQLSVNANGQFSITGLTADKNYKSLTMTGELADGTSATFHVNNDPSAVTWDESNYTAEAGGDLICTVGKGWAEYWDGEKAGQSITVTLTLSDDSTVSKTVVLAK